VVTRETKATLQASMAVRSERTTRELLSLLCDCVVALNDSFCVADRSMALAALLFSSSWQGLRGVPFEDLVRDEDRERFREFITSTVQPQCLHLHLRDCNDALVPVQLFHSRLETVLGQISHLVGIREERDLYQRSPPEVELEEGLGRSKGRTGHRQMQEEFVSLNSEFSDCLECSFTANASSDSLPLLSCTPCFTAICGPLLSGVGFTDWIVGDKEAFLTWVRESAQAQYTDSETPCCMRVVVAPPHSQRLGHIHADCNLCLVEDPDEVMVKIYLTNVLTQSSRNICRHGTRRVGTRRLSM